MPTFLNKSNQPKRITSRQLTGFFRAQKESFSANDNYNREKFGLDRVTYLWIREAVHSLSGAHGEKPKLGEINKWFADRPWTHDGDGNYLTYLNRTVRVS